MSAVSRSIGSLRDSPAARSSRERGKLVILALLYWRGGIRARKLCHQSCAGGTTALPRWRAGVFSPHSEARGETVMPLDDGSSEGGGGGRSPSRNVLGERLEACSTKPVTGFFRNGCCDTGPADRGSHTVCVVATAGFLEFSKSRGNDLSTPMPEHGFPGLKPG